MKWGGGDGLGIGGSEGEGGMRTIRVISSDFSPTMTGMKIRKLGQSVQVVVQSSKLLYFILTRQKQSRLRGIHKINWIYWFGCQMLGRVISSSFFSFSQSPPALHLKIECKTVSVGRRREEEKRPGKY